VGLFGLAIVAASLGLVYLPVALAAVTVAYVALRIVSLSQIYEAVEWPVIVLLASLIPIGAAAKSLSVNPDAMLMGVAVAASCAFLTPIGHKNNTIIMGPGGYAFGDYWRLGLPLELIVLAVSVPLILTVWPL